MVDTDNDSDCAQDKQHHIVVVLTVVGTDLFNQGDRLEDDESGENGQQEQFCRFDHVKEAKG